MLVTPTAEYSSGRIVRSKISAASVTIGIIFTSRGKTTIARRPSAHGAAAGKFRDRRTSVWIMRSHVKDPDAIDRVLRKHATAIGLGRGFSAHSMRATFITTARWRTAQRSTTCSVRPGTPSQAPPNFATGAGIIRRSQRVSLRHIKNKP